MKKILTIFSASLLWVLTTLPANSEMGAGVSILFGQVDANGTETEKTVTGVTSETTSADTLESSFGYSIFGEYRFDNRFALGLEYIPVDLSVGAGNRTDNSSGADAASEADTGDRSVSADLSDLFVAYARVPVPMTNSFYVKLGYHDADLQISESLPTSSYPDVDLNGIEYGIGFQSEDGRARFELAHVDYDDITVTGTGSGETNQNKVDADADATLIRLSYGF
tara:strand:- start:16 stop:687 length:672 start_codon:yes stop_codon:yes gene_type:complete